MSRCCLVISLILVAGAPGASQSTEHLGGNWNNPTSAAITNIIIDRYAHGHPEKNRAARNSSESTTTAKPNDASLHFRSTGTQLKTQEIANLIGPGNPQVPLNPDLD
jgi:hypothetical protein